MRVCFEVALGALLLMPAVAFAATPFQWAGPYVGVDAGLNHSSPSGFSGENSFTVGLNAGWNTVAGPLWGIYFAGGISAFYRWNGNRDHSTCVNSSRCANVNMGSNVYGINTFIGFPIGPGEILCHI